MSLNAKKIPGGKRKESSEPLEAGSYPARVAQVIGLGLQAQSPYNGKEKDPRQEARFVYEMADEFMKGEDGEEILDRPRWQHEILAVHPLSSDLANSTKRYYALDPKDENDGDFFGLVNRPCLLSLTWTPSKKDPSIVYNNVANVSTMRSKDQANAPELVQDPVIFDFYEPDLDVFLSFPTFIQDRIKKSLDWQGSKLRAMVEGSDTGSKEEASETPEEESSNDSDW